MYIHTHVCICAFVCVCLCEISNQSTSKTLVICVKPSVNLAPCYITHTSSYC